MKNFDPRKYLEGEYDATLSYSFYISAAIVQGKHDLAFQFLDRNKDKKGIKGIILLSPSLSIVYFEHLPCTVNV